MTAASPLRIGVVVFPGINTDGDTHHALETFPGVTAEYLWHKDTDLEDFKDATDAIGDHLSKKAEETARRAA